MRVARHNKISSRVEIGEPSTAESSPLHAAGAVATDTDVSTLPWSRGIQRVPTHTVGRASERRAYVRARIALPLRVQCVAGKRDPELGALHTRDISSSGVFFLSPRRIEPGTPIELEVVLVDRPFGSGTVRMCTQACVVRVEEAEKPGWHGLAAAFDDITFVRDESFLRS
jgi:c-di-GMP-binding flagellar brake protein YcgR